MPRSMRCLPLELCDLRLQRLDLLATFTGSFFLRRCDASNDSISLSTTNASRSPFAST